MRNIITALLMFSVINTDGQTLNVNVPFIHYTISVSNKDTSSFTVEMQIKNAPRSFQLAMVKHIEYDDRFWRYLTNLESNASIIRLDSALWQVKTNKQDVSLNYTLHLPQTTAWRGSWKPFVSSNGALIGGPHSFLYIVGQTHLPAHISIIKPADWKISSGLTSTLDPNIFYAHNVEELVDEPILTGDFHFWTFIINGTPHNVAYQQKQNVNWFDTTAIVNGIQKIVNEAGKIFNGFPYRDYTFQILDESYGGLEHKNSVTLGESSIGLKEDMRELFAEVAHEYFHTWNLVRIRPAEYGDVTYKSSPVAKELWWSEGATMYYQQILLIRAGLPMYDISRIKHLEEYMSRYYSETGNRLISPVKVSESSNAGPGILGDYSASTHLQGELLSTLIDIKIRSITNSNKSLDDLMRWMMFHFGNGKGFTNADIERGIKEISGWNAHVFFQQYIYGNHEFDFNTYLKEIGLNSSITWIDAITGDGKPETDKRVYAWVNSKGVLLLGITDPASIWGKAGLHTSEEIVSINGHRLTTQRQFFDEIRNIKFGDEVVIVVKPKTNSTPITKIIHLTGYKKAVVKIKELPVISSIQKNLYDSWAKAK